MGSPIINAQSGDGISAIAYFEQRLAVLTAEQPLSPEGRAARNQTLHDLRNQILVLRLQEVNALHRSLADAWMRP